MARRRKSSAREARPRLARSIRPRRGLVRPVLLDLLVLATAALELVLAGTALQGVFARLAVELVVPTQADHHVPAGGSFAHVVAARAEDGRRPALAGGRGRRGLRAGPLDGGIGRALILGLIAETVAVGIRLDLRRNEDPATGQRGGGRLRRTLRGFGCAA